MAQLKYLENGVWVAADTIPQSSDTNPGLIRVYNGLDQVETGFALDASQGKILQDQIDILCNNIHPFSTASTYTSSATAKNWTYTQCMITIPPNCVYVIRGYVSYANSPVCDCSFTNSATSGPWQGSYTNSNTYGHLYKTIAGFTTTSSVDWYLWSVSSVASRSQGASIMGFYMSLDIQN